MLTHVSDYVELQRQLLQIERDFERDEFLSSTDGAKLTNLETSGLAITRLRVHSATSDIGGRQVIKFFPLAKRRIGAVRLSTGDVVAIREQVLRKQDSSSSSNSPTILGQSEGIITYIDDSSVEVACDTPFDDDDHTLYSIVKITSDVTHNRYNSALTLLERVASDTTHCAYRLVNVLLGDATPGFASDILQTVSSRTVDHIDDENDILLSSLNDSQRAAVDLSLRAEDLAVIHGPPGTGKTHTLITYVAKEVLRGRRVLVVAPSNVAIDNMAERLAGVARTQRLKFVRAGHPARMTAGAQPHSLDAHVEASDEAQLARDVAHELAELDRRGGRAKSREERIHIRTEQRKLRRELRQREKAAVMRVLDQTNVLLATISGAGGRVLDMAEHGRPFDVVVVDEAAQALEGCVWPALLRARKAVLAGDPYQLAGTVKSPVALERGFQKSIMDRIFNCDRLAPCVTMLTTQYRMHSIICDWSSDEFYDGRLEPDESVADRRVTDLEGWVALPDDDDGVHFPFIMIDTAGGDCEEDNQTIESTATNRDVKTASHRNHGEAGIVRRIVEEFLKHGVKATDIGVISPYAGQVELMRHELWDKFGRELEVATIDSFQGREKEIICISLVRSNEAGDVGFLSDARRLNVAITRARRCVMVVCDSETVCSHPFLERLVQYAEQYGVYRSAVVEFEDIVGTFSQLRRPKEAIEAEGRALRSQNENKVALQTNQVDNGKKSVRKNRQEGIIKKDNDDDMSEEKRVQVRNRIEREVKKFLDNDLLVERWFSKDLTAMERRTVHEVAEEVNICHASSGFGRDRQVRIWKPRDIENGESELKLQHKDDILEILNKAEKKEINNEIANTGTEGEDDTANKDASIEEENEQTENEQSNYQESNNMLLELQRAREERANIAKKSLEQKEGMDNGCKTAKRGKKGGGGKGKAKRGGKDKDENLSFEETLEKYGFQDQGSNSNSRFSKTVNQIMNGHVVNGVLVNQVDSHNLERNKAAKKKLSEKLAKEADKRKRKGK